MYPHTGREGFRAGRKIFERTCGDCGTKWFPENGGLGRRHASRCDGCYPFYRQACTLYHACKTRATNENLELDLTIEWIQDRIKECCPRTGLPFIIGKGSDFSNRHPQTPSVDKIDPSGGYTKLNVQIVCWWYNSAKQRYTDEEVLKFCKAVVDSSNT